MSDCKRMLSSLIPLALMERHRRKFRMGQLGLPGSCKTESAVSACRFDLWPLKLRRSPMPWTLVDVGANTGEFTEAAASLVQLESVHAFEPQPSCHPKLSKILQGIPNSHLHPAAVGNKAGEIELLCTANPKMASVLKPATGVAGDYSPGDFNIQQHLKVPLVRLDDVIPEGTSVGLLKIDVQGYELPVLEGATRTLRSTNALLMEVNYVPHYEGGAVFDDIFEAVRRQGFRTFGISAPYGGPDGPLWADALFIRTD